MFERYAEAARNAIFWALYRAGQAGSCSIEPEHLLAGILSVEPDLVQRFPQLAEFAPAPVPKQSRNLLRRDMPLSRASKLVLAYGAEESKRLKLGHTSPEHLLLGLLREGKSRVAGVLHAHGLTLEELRQNLSLDRPSL